MTLCGCNQSIMHFFSESLGEDDRRLIQKPKAEQNSPDSRDPDGKFKMIIIYLV